jgi:hypothetical protein
MQQAARDGQPLCSDSTPEDDDHSIIEPIELLADAA